MTSSSLLSPRLVALQAELEMGQTDELDAFWREVAEQGAPLIEPIADDTERSLVTFLWRDTEGLENIVVIGGPAGEDVINGQMTRLAGTDVWHKSYKVRNDVRTTYFFSPNDPLVRIGAEGWEELWQAWVEGGNLQIDPLNPHTLWEEESILTLPGAPHEPWLEPREGVPEGQVEQHTVRSEILGNERSVWVYTPPGYTTEGAAYGWALWLDGDGYVYAPTPTILDNLIAEKRIPPLVGIFVANVDYTIRSYEMSCNPQFNAFLTQELLPWARERYHLTNDPRQAIIFGASYGGLAATFAALRHPDVFGNVIAQSGAFYWRQGQDRAPDSGEDTDWGWIIRQFIAAERLRLRFHISVGCLEVDPDPWGAHTNALCSSRHMRDVLRAKGYDVDYVEYAGAHDFVGWGGVAPRALEKMTR